MRMNFGAAMAAACVLAAANDASATPITLTMDEVPTQAVDGLIVSKGGLDFEFEGGPNLFYNSFGPGDVTYVDDPSIQGTTAGLSVFFSTPVHRISFGLAELVQPGGLAPFVFMTDGEVLTINMDLADPFPEGRFFWRSNTRTVRGFVLFPDRLAQAIAFDNLTVDTEPGVPEPASWALMLVGFGALGVVMRRSRARRRAHVRLA